jgi:hypothetical protein
LFRHPVRFLLIDIIRFADFELRLENPGSDESLNCAVADGPLEESDLLIG